MNVQIILMVLFLGLIDCQENLKNSNVVNTEKLSLYIQWRQSNERVFMNADEKIFRQMIFLENLDKINKFNEDPQITYKMSLNQFSDMTEEEFVSKILTPEAQVSQDDQETGIRKLQFEIDKPKLEIKKVIFQSVDWRRKGAVTPVKNQGQCGSCWAFSTVAMMESFNYIRRYTLKDLSEQQVIDCAIPEKGLHSYGCRGGYQQDALEYSALYGVLEESQYPYVAVQGKCKISQPIIGFAVRYYRNVPATVDDLKDALYFSPVSVRVDARNWQFYTSGIFNGCSSTPVLTHAVLLVGYDLLGNWIIKNSWGTTWGEDGFMRLKYGNNCGIIKSCYQITDA